MNDYDRRRYEMLVRVKQFGIDNAADMNPTATNKFTIIGTLVDEIESESAEQQSGFSEAAQQFEVKGTARENLRDRMADTRDTARGMEPDFDGIYNKFRFERGLNDASLLARARAFIIEAGPYKSDFANYGLSPDIVTELTTLADAFEATFATTATATAEHVEATATVADKISQGMIETRSVSPIVLNIYANDFGKQTAWRSASHVEKPPKKKTPPTP
jgi:hypothetical protein